VTQHSTGTKVGGDQPPHPDLDLVVVGGCGHAGLPLSLAFATRGARVGVYDLDAEKVERVRAGQMPFMERGADVALAELLPTGRLEITADPTVIGRSDVVVMVVGTPIDEFMNPSLRVFERAIDELVPRLRDGALVVLRSTVFPGTTEFVATRLDERGVQAEVVFCPERIAEGHALEELHSMPQLIGAFTTHAFARASALFQRLGVEIVRTTPKEAELAKLLTNTWRYMKFAIANQFFQIAHKSGIDYGNVLRAIRHNYPRASDLPGPGFAAGPCLLKDTMQLAAFCSDHFPMGNAAMLVNEGMPAYIVETLDERKRLAGRTLGVLGMAFKGESDDPRSSLSYKLKKLAAFKGARVLCTDPYVPDPTLEPLDKVLHEADVLVIGAPHRAYRDLDLAGREVVDIWGLLGDGNAL
jgi:UDP-N-acetyl-D-mannosaminuronic acid dehydrogenase